MKRTTNVVIQILALIAQVLNLATGMAGEKARPWIGLSILLVQGVAAVIASNYNPDGTPATVAYKSGDSSIRSAIKLVLISMLIGLLTTQNACSPKQLQTFKAAGDTVVATADGIDTTLESLISQGKLTSDQTVFVRTYLSQGVLLVGKINALVQQINSWPPANAAQILDLINQTATLIDEATSQGTIKFGNDATMQKVALTLAILKGGLSTIKTLLGGKPVTASVLDDLKNEQNRLNQIQSE